MKLALLLLLGAVVSVRPVRWVEVCRDNPHAGELVLVGCEHPEDLLACWSHEPARACDLKPECENPDGGWVTCYAR